MVYYGNSGTKILDGKFRKQILILDDNGEMILDWYPHKITTKLEKKPIVIILLGIFGNKEDYYVRAYLELITKKNWRCVILNRRGFDKSKLKSDKFLGNDEIDDLNLAIETIADENPESPLYMVGISNGANIGSRILGQFGDKTPIKAFVSISNPYNFSKIAFSLRFSWKEIWCRK